MNTNKLFEKKNYLCTLKLVKTSEELLSYKAVSLAFVNFSGQNIFRGSDGSGIFEADTSMILTFLKTIQLS